MEILIWLVALGGSLTLLVIAADYFTQSAERIGLYFGLSSFIVGATIVSIGSSMPELASSIIAVLNDVSDFPVSNAIGSNIANCLLIGGVASIMVGTLKVKHTLIDVDLPFFFCSTALFILLALDKVISVADAIIMLAFLAIFIFYTIFDQSKNHLQAIADLVIKPKDKLSWKELIFLVGGAVGIYFGADFTIKSVNELGALLKVSASVIAMIAVAIGTSLPELVISIRAAMKGNHSVAMGNIFGSNTFNVLAVTGIPAFFGTVNISAESWEIGLPFLIVTTLAFIFVTADDRIQKWEGMALLMIYVTFIGMVTGFI